ncbi:MAG: 2-phosphosulfolactate phosphatase [Thermoleophilaceae bacterium]
MSVEGDAGGRSLDVAFVPGEARPADVSVVVDVLRATSTIADALSNGWTRVLCAGTVDAARALRGPGRALAGERDCRRIPDFDHGNSPGALGPGKGHDLVLSTTNGTPAILAAADRSDKVLLGALLNLEAVARAIPPDADVTLVCAGTDGRFALEDAYFAGRLVAVLRGERTDAARAAERIAGSYPGPLEPLAESADAAVLRETGQEADIHYCARESVLDVVPEVEGVEEDLAVVVASRRPDPVPGGALA